MTFFSDAWSQVACSSWAVPSDVPSNRLVTGAPRAVTPPSVAPLRSERPRLRVSRSSLAAGASATVRGRTRLRAQGTSSEPSPRGGRTRDLHRLRKSHRHSGPVLTAPSGASPTLTRRAPGLQPQAGQRGDGRAKGAFGAGGCDPTVKTRDGRRGTALRVPARGPEAGLGNLAKLLRSRRRPRAP